MQVRLNVKGLDTAVNKLEGDKKPIMRRGIRRIADIYRDEAQDQAPQNTGKFAKGIHKSSAGDMAYNIVESGKVGVFIREGTVSHPIFPKRVKALMWLGLPHPVAYVLNHPGTKPNAYDERAVDAAETEVQAELDMIGQELADSMGGG